MPNIEYVWSGWHPDDILGPPQTFHDFVCGGPFDVAEFYDEGTVVELRGRRGCPGGCCASYSEHVASIGTSRRHGAAAISVPGIVVSIESCGKRDWVHNDGRKAVRTAGGFRAIFPDGHITSDWQPESNGWFEVHDPDAFEDDDNVYYSLREALIYARQIVEARYFDARPLVSKDGHVLDR